ncbi:protease inhibitor [Streptomyces inhibens]|uniref:Protease inhibitor n=1 Tax=Streptomyces inhibens TaxID=2293571 RepID=A0A371Q9T3_STRIH|nr:SSI family serine proteinase inhibitor [Streptomyces inhibens]REK91203.1 protease inhibitor [Streptomyces inhibens]
MPVTRRRRSARATVSVTVLATVSAALAVALSAGPAGADETTPPDQGLQLTVSGSGNTWMRGVRLNCPDTQGRHPHATAACDALTWARGDMDALPGEPRNCTKQYDPVTVTATGSWRGGPVNWRKEYANACMMDSATGPVFRF